MSDAGEWRIWYNDREFGPVKHEALVRLIASNQLNDSVMLWRPGLGDKYVPLAELRHLFKGRSDAAYSEAIEPKFEGSSETNTSTVQRKPAIGSTQGAVQVDVLQETSVAGVETDLGTGVDTSVEQVKADFHDIQQPGGPRLRGWIEGYNDQRKNGWIRLNGSEKFEGVSQFYFSLSEFPVDATPVLRDVVEFAVGEPHRGALSARAIKLIIQRERGKVKSWDEKKGYGFIRRENGEDVFVHYTSIKEEGPRSLLAGEEVEFTVESNDKGKDEAANIRVFQSRFELERFANIDDLRRGRLLEELKTLAADEPWVYRNKPSRTPYPVLYSYVLYTFARLLEENREGKQKILIAEASDGRKIACGNTGLVTTQQEEIFGVFVENRKSGPQKWALHKFVKASDRNYMVHFKTQPDIADYFSDPSALLYDPSIELRVNVDHIIEDNIDRFPEALRANPFSLRQAVDGALINAQKRVRRNYKTAIPQFHKGELQLLLPLCLSRPEVAELALVVSRESEVYIGSTVLELDQAYNNARLIAKPDREWL